MSIGVVRPAAEGEDTVLLTLLISFFRSCLAKDVVTDGKSGHPISLVNGQSRSILYRCRSLLARLRIR